MSASQARTARRTEGRRDRRDERRRALGVKGGPRAKWKDRRWVRGLKGDGPYEVPLGPLWQPARQAREKYRTRTDAVTMSGSVRKVLDYLLNTSDDGLKPSWHSQERIADVIQCNERTVERAVARLKEIGLIVVDECKFVQPCEARPHGGRARTNGFRRIRTNRYYFVIDICDHRGLLTWFRSQVRPARNPGTGPEQPLDDTQSAPVANLDGTTPERNTGPPGSPGDIPTPSDPRDESEGPRRFSPEAIAEIAQARSALGRRPRSHP